MPTLHVLKGADKGQTFQMPKEPAVLGRKSEQIPLTDNSVSRRHAELRPENGHWYLADLGSSNGTHVNGVQIHEPRRLKHGDQIKLGGTLLVFTGEDSADQFGGPEALQEMVRVDRDGSMMDSSILAAVSSSDDSLILATPETADAVHAWQVMYQLAEVIGSGLDISTFLERVADIIIEHLTVDRVFILMIDGPEEALSTRVVRFRGKIRGKNDKITTSQTIISHVVEAKEGVLCTNAMTDERFSPETKGGSIHRFGLHSVICVPVIAHDVVQGVIHLDCSMSQHTYTNDQLRLVVAIGRMTGMAIENSRLLESRVAHERLAAVGETVAHLSHYIRNVLQGMRSGADVLEMGLDRENLATIASGWEVMQRNIDRTLQLTTNMITFSKERAPAVEIAQLNHAVQEAVSLVQRQADDKGVMLLVELCDDLPPVAMDVEGMIQVAINVMHNALDAVEKNSGRINLRTSHGDQGERVVLSISDNGPGIAPEEVDAIFDAFHSTKGHGGTGLGLAAAKQIMSELGGQIEVETAEGKGCTFHISLPVRTIRLSGSDKTHGPRKRR